MPAAEGGAAAPSTVPKTNRELNEIVAEGDIFGAFRNISDIQANELCAVKRSDGLWRYAKVIVCSANAITFMVHCNGSTKDIAPATLVLALARPLRGRPLDDGKFLFPLCSCLKNRWHFFQQLHRRQFHPHHNAPVNDHMQVTDLRYETQLHVLQANARQLHMVFKGQVRQPSYYIFWTVR
jgi:hypothetical protein